MNERYVFERAVEAPFHWELYDTQDQERRRYGIVALEVVYPPLDDIPVGDMLCPQVDYAHGYVVITSLMPLALPDAETLDSDISTGVVYLRYRLPRKLVLVDYNGTFQNIGVNPS